jgi:hypothetical protein
MNFWLAVSTVVAFAGLCSGQGDALKLALSIKPKISIVVFVEKELASSLSEEQVKNDAELLLRQSNIPVVITDANAGLRISVRAARLSLSRGSLYGVVTKVAYLEHVVPAIVLAGCLVDDGKKDKMYECVMGHAVLKELWSEDAVMVVGDDRLPDLRGCAKDLVQKFVLEYLRASDLPKK